MNVSMTPSHPSGSFRSVNGIGSGGAPSAGNGVIDPWPVFAAWSSDTLTWYQRPGSSGVTTRHPSPSRTANSRCVAEKSRAVDSMTPRPM